MLVTLGWPGPLCLSPVPLVTPPPLRPDKLCDSDSFSAPLASGLQESVCLGSWG